MITNIYRLIIKCGTESPDLDKENGSPYIVILIRETEPQYETLARIRASLSTPQNIVYNHRDFTIIDYFGKGVILEDRINSAYAIIGKNEIRNTRIPTRIQTTDLGTPNTSLEPELRG